MQFTDDRLDLFAWECAECGFKVIGSSMEAHCGRRMVLRGYRKRRHDPVLTPYWKCGMTQVTIDARHTPVEEVARTIRQCSIHYGYECDWEVGSLVG